MTAKGYLLRTALFMIVFAIATFGLMFDASSDELSQVDWPSYFLSVGTMIFCGMFCIGKANRYLLVTMVAITVFNYMAIMSLDAILPLSGYVRILMFPLTAYFALKIMFHRNVLTMWLNRVKRKPGNSPFKWLLNQLFEEDLPTRETNFSLVMVLFAKLLFWLDVLFAFVSLNYYFAIGMGYNELYSSYVASGDNYNFGVIRDEILYALETGMALFMVVHSLYDGKRPDAQGLDLTATYDKAALARLHV